MSGFTLVGYIYRCQVCGADHPIPVSSLGNFVMCWHEGLRPPRQAEVNDRRDDTSGGAGA